MAPRSRRRASRRSAAQAQDVESPEPVKVEEEQIEEDAVEDEQPEDVEMEDGNDENENENDEDNDNENQGEGEEDGEEDEEEEEDDEGEEEAASTPRRRTQPTSRRRGRPSLRERASQRLDSEDVEGSVREGTPKKKGVFRGAKTLAARRKARAELLAANITTTQAPIDHEGNLGVIEDDEVVLPSDPDGEMKVDKLGNLADGREYRVRTFTVMNRGQRQYMLSTEPARCMGFRDSYLFFQKHRQLYKVTLDDEEKLDLISRGMMPHSYKGRTIGVVTARSVFREFGAKIIVGGRKITDDYYVAQARENGDVEGELAAPEERYAPESKGYGLGAQRQETRRKIHVTSTNWMTEHAKDSSRFNNNLVAARKEAFAGVYEPHTNKMHLPGILQPTHARWEWLGLDGDLEDSSLTPKITKATTKRFGVSDIYYANPPYSGLGTPGLDAYALTEVASGNCGSLGLTDVPDSVMDELPDECLTAFIAARNVEHTWKTSWTNEHTDGHRANLHITYLASGAGS